jgi:zinc protease
MRTLRSLALFCLLALLLATLHGYAQAPQPAPSTFNAQDVIPFDAAVRTGTLPNGLTYFIRRNTRPEKRVSLRLAVKAGSLYEENDQLGLAHLIEHMAFNGSVHFKPGELVSYFESTGARLGPHVNAYTSFDETVYMLELPTDNADIVSRGFTALADFAGGLSLDPEQIDKERGVVIEEWRGRLGAGSRIQDKQLPLMFYGSRYAERLPIGKPEILRTAPAARLRAFYDQWYRPERIAIVAVGDIDAAQAEQTVRSAFGGLTARAPAGQAPNGQLPLHSELLINVATDPELTSSSVRLVTKQPAERQDRVGDYRRNLVERLFADMLNDRFGELARKPDAKFLGAGGGGGLLTPSVQTFTLNARVPDGSLIDGVNLLEIEARRVREHGFNQSELDRNKREMTAYYEQAYNERDKSESGGYADEYVRHFLEGEAAPGIEYEYRLVQSVLPGITLDEVTTLARSRLSGQSRVVFAVQPEKPNLPPPSEGDLRSAITAADQVAVTPWSDSTTTRALVENLPEPARVESRREIANIGVTVLRFANGLEAWLKPTDFKNDQVLFAMYALGGASLASRTDFVDASLASTYVGFSGAGGLKALDLQRVLAGKLASASPFISSSTHGINGSAAPADLETALQLLYQFVVAPGDDAEAFGLMKRQLEASIANRGRSPGQVFGERLAQINTSNHYTSDPLTEKDIQALDRARMMSFYRARFANAADFTFFMVGTFDLDKAIPLLARYVGSLPSTAKRTSEFKDIGVRFPNKIVTDRVEKGREPQARTVISFFADPSPDPVEQERVGAATLVLETALRDTLREDLGQTYTVSVGLAQSLPQRGDGHTQVSFGAAPENIKGMTDRVLQEVRRFQQETPSEDLTSRAKESARRGYETALRQNSYWLQRLRSVHMLGRDPGEILNRVDRINAITPTVVQEAFRKYFPLDRYTVVTLVPEPAQQ